MKSFLQFHTESTKWVMFSDLEYDEKVKRLSTYPYSKDKFYHVTNPSNLKQILKEGLTGEEIWVTKSKPWKNYTDGILLELDLKGFQLFDDNRWVKSAGVKVVTKPIPPTKITKVFEWFESLGEREDRASVIGSEKVDKVPDLIKRYKL